MSLSEFAKDVEKGLSKQPKSLPSKYFYDERGDQIFQSIMNMPSYYLTRAEFEIFSHQKTKIHNILKKEIGDRHFQLVEFGAGDGLKTKLLIDHFQQNEVNFEYVPIDISPSVLKKLKTDLKDRWPNLQCRELVNSYQGGLSELEGEVPKVILFLGSNLGNFLKEEAQSFITMIFERLRKNDLVIFGIDLKKDPQIIMNAYNDPEGITRAFNLNLLERMNRELGADFEIDQFSHFPTYDPITGICKSFLISNRAQKVSIDSLKKTFQFESAEAIHTEISIKYSLNEVENLFTRAGFNFIEHLHDCKHYFVDTIWKK